MLCAQVPCQHPGIAVLETKPALVLELRQLHGTVHPHDGIPEVCLAQVPVQAVYGFEGLGAVSTDESRGQLL